MKKLIAIRCIGDHSHGYGHFSRCLAIANYFSKKNYSIIFLINDNVYLKKELSKTKLNSIASSAKTGWPSPSSICNENVFLELAKIGFW